MTELEKWKAILESAKELAGNEVTAEVAALEAKVAALEAEVVASVETLTATKDSIDYHKCLNTALVAVVLLKLFGII